MIAKGDSKEFNVCSAPHPEGYMLLPLDNVKEFQFLPPTFSPQSKQLKGHNLLQAESFVLPHAKESDQEDSIDYVRVDISKDLEVLDEEEAFEFVNKIIKPELQDTTSIISHNCAHYRGEIKKRGSPVGKDFVCSDIETTTNMAPQIAKTLQDNHPPEKNPLIMSFPFHLSTHETSFMVFAKKSDMRVEPTELLNRVASLEKMDSLLLNAVIRTKYSILIHIDLPAIPSASELTTSKLDWLNDKCKKAGLILFNTDNSYAVRSDTPPAPRSPPVYVPTSNKAAVVKSPRSVSFRECTRAISLFGSFSAIHPLDNNPSAKSHQYYEALFDNLGFSILVHNETIQGIKFISVEPNIIKKTTSSKQKNTNTPQTMLCPNGNSPSWRGKNLARKSKFNQPIVGSTSHQNLLSCDSAPLFL